MRGILPHAQKALLIIKPNVSTPRSLPKILPRNASRDRGRPRSRVRGTRSEQNAVRQQRRQRASISVVIKLNSKRRIIRRSRQHTLLRHVSNTPHKHGFRVDIQTNSLPRKNKNLVLLKDRTIVNHNEKMVSIELARDISSPPTAKSREDNIRKPKSKTIGPDRNTNPLRAAVNQTKRPVDERPMRKQHNHIGSEKTIHLIVKITGNMLSHNKLAWNITPSAREVIDNEVPISTRRVMSSSQKAMFIKEPAVNWS